MKFLLFSLIIFLIVRPNIFAQRNESDLKNNYHSLITGNMSQTSLMDKYDIKFCKIDISVSDTTKFISGNVKYRVVVVKSQLDTFMLQLSDDFTVDSVIFNNSNIVFTHSGDEIRVKLTPSLNIGDTIDISVYYSGLPENEPDDRGITSSYDSSNHQRVTFSLSEPFYALDWFPCKQDLTDKIDSAYIFITVDSSLKAGSNGLLKAITHLSGNKLRFEWQTYYPIDYYLLSFSVSDYLEYDFYVKPHGFSDSVFVQNYVYSNSFNYFQPFIDSTKDYMEYFTGLFGLYPFANEKYGHCMIPVGGGMEHQTMTSLGYFDRIIISHELSHQWFGDATTCSNWQDIWLNEGFGSYCEYLATDKFSSFGKDWIETAHNYSLIKPSGSVYVPFESINDARRIFDYALTYLKGAAIIHQLRHEVNNDSLFFLALRNYLTKFKFKEASAVDFRLIFDSTTQKNFTDFFNEWYYGFGFPLYSINWYQQNDTLSINCFQSTSSDSTTLFKSSLDFKFYYPGGDTIIRVFQDTNSKLYKFLLPFHVDSITLDPDNWLIKKILYINKGIKNISLDNLIIAPNPFSNEILINSENDYSEKDIELYDVTGKKFLSERSKNKIVKINTSYLNKGIYILKITGKTTMIKKLVKI